MKNEERFLIEQKQDRIALITMNQHSICNKWVEELSQNLKKLNDDDTIKVIMIMGKGKRFLSGLNLSMLNGGQEEENSSFPDKVDWFLRDVYKPLADFLRHMKKLVICIINGKEVRGIGISLAFCCDLTIMAEEGSFLLGYNKYGLIPDGGLTYFLQEKLGYHKALEIISSREKIPADQCKELALVNRLAPSSILLEEAEKWAEELVHPPAFPSYILAKKLYSEQTQENFDRFFQAEVRYQKEVVGTKEFRNSLNRKKTQKTPEKIEPLPTTTGKGSCTGHFGELFQGHLYLGGKKAYSLLSMPFSELSSEATLSLGSFSQEPTPCLKAQRGIQLVMKKYRDGRNFQLTIQSSIPQGCGLGSSTADIVAGLHAYGEASGNKLTAEEILSICFEAEGACDNPVHFPEMVLWQSRQGQEAYSFQCPYPSLAVLGWIDGGEGQVETDSVSIPPHTSLEIETFQQAFNAVCRSIENQSGVAEALCHLSLTSASTHQSYLPKKDFWAAGKVAKKFPGMGIIVAHSGTAIGLIMPGELYNPSREKEMKKEILAQIGAREIFTISP